MPRSGIVYADLLGLYLISNARLLAADNKTLLDKNVHNALEVSIWQLFRELSLKRTQ